MRQYHELVKEVLTEGYYKPNRTGVDTISAFDINKKYNLSEGFPLVTTKSLEGKKWNSLVRELLWYLSGESHIKELRKNTKIWDIWADEEGNLQTAYGRFWRRFPIPSSGLPGEAWADPNGKGAAWIRTEQDGSHSIDQIAFILDEIKRNPNSRRLIVSAWHPANATVSKLPPCHYTWALNVLNNKLNLHLSQRSADIALGVPFNIACYSAITQAIAQETGLGLGIFGHTLIDAHIYCGSIERGEFYRNSLDELKSRIKDSKCPDDYIKVREWIETSAPAERESGLDHIPGLLLQLSRAPNPLPRLTIARKPLDSLVLEDFNLENYNPHPNINFKVAP